MTKQRKQPKKLTRQDIVGTRTARKSVTATAVCIGVLGVALVAAGCGGRTAKELPFGNVDTPKPGASAGRTVRVSGWALSHAKIETVEVYLDRMPAGRWPAGVGRPDVQAVHPGYPDSEKAGFDFQVDLTGKPAGTHELTVQVRSSDDAVRELCSFPILVGP